MNFDISKINWKSLREQKKALLELIWDDKDSPIMGIIHLIDDIQDTAVDKYGMDKNDVYLFEEEDEK